MPTQRLQKYRFPVYLLVEVANGDPTLQQIKKDCHQDSLFLLILL